MFICFETKVPRFAYSQGWTNDNPVASRAGLQLLFTGTAIGHRNDGYATQTPGAYWVYPQYQVLNTDINRWEVFFNLSNINPPCSFPCNRTSNESTSSSYMTNPLFYW